MSSHHAEIRWTLQGGDFLHRQYSREHTWHFDGGICVPASASPLIVPKPWSSDVAIDPEEAFVASISSCHMLWFLHEAAIAGMIVRAYHDRATGVMTKNERDQLWISHVTLRPRIQWDSKTHPTSDQIDSLHHRAHEQCFIANSVRTEIRVDSNANS